ncbi:hypothetical protein PINS_up023576 [Pythium insidiosum]|nr:hypothetical protein PINS_up023576 [Pythium insidiosum]
MITLLQRELATATSPPPAPPAPPANNSAAAVAAAAAATTAYTLFTLFPFSSARCVTVLTALGRMIDRSETCKRMAKAHGVLTVALQALKVPNDIELHQCADKVLHLCVFESSPAEDVDGATPRFTVDPQLFSAVAPAATTNDTDVAEPSSTPSKPALLSVDVILSVFELGASSTSFRLLRWLSITVHSSANAKALGAALMPTLCKIAHETPVENALQLGFAAKCIQMITLQSSEACDVCGQETASPVIPLLSFLRSQGPAVLPAAPSGRVVSVVSETEALSEPVPSPIPTSRAVERHSIEWPEESAEPETFAPHVLTDERQEIDPFLHAAMALETLATAFARFNTISSESGGATTDFAELVAQRRDPSAKAAAAAPNMKKKTETGLKSVPGEAVAVLILEKATEILKLLYVFTTRNADAAISLLRTVTALARLPGGVKTMLLQSKSELLALKTGDDVDDGASSSPSPPSPTASPSSPSSSSSPWPFTRDECVASEFASLLAPVSSVLEIPQTCFFQVEAAVDALAALTADVEPDAPSPTLSGVVTTVELVVKDSDRLVNTALHSGLLVSLIACLDDIRLPQCPNDSEHRSQFKSAIQRLVTRFISLGSTKQQQLEARRQELLEMSEQLAATQAAAPTTGTSKQLQKAPELQIDAASLQAQRIDVQQRWASELLELRVDVHRFGYLRYPALLLAVEVGQLEIAVALLSAGVSADVASPTRTTPLMLALLLKHDDLWRQLVVAGADLDAITRDGQDLTVWSCALVTPARELVDRSISRLYNTRQSPLPLEQVLDLDVVRGSPQYLLELLGTSRLDVNVSNSDGDFLLHALVSSVVVRRTIRGVDVCFRYVSRQLDASLLLSLVTTVVEQHRANLDACNHHGQTALHVALLNGHGAVALYLLQRGANPNIRDAIGCLPLHYACLGFFESAALAEDVVSQLLAAATRFELRSGQHMDDRKDKTRAEKTALAVEQILDEGLATATASAVIQRRLATKQDVLQTATLEEQWLPWHLACGAGGHLHAPSFCLSDDMNRRLLRNGELRASLLRLLQQQHGVELHQAAARRLSPLHLAIKTDIGGSNAAVIEVLLAAPGVDVNAVHDAMLIDALYPIPEGAEVEVRTPTLSIPQAFVSTRSFDHQYHVLLPDGTHLDKLQRHQLKSKASALSYLPNNATSSSNTRLSQVLTARYMLVMESAFSPLHYALQSSDTLSLQLLELPAISLQPEGCDLPLLALACAARRSADIVSRLVNQQANVRVYLPLHDGSSQDVIEITARQAAAAVTAVASAAPTGHRASFTGGGGLGNASGARCKQAAPLHYAVMYDDVATVQALVRRRDCTNVNVRRSGDGFTPLHLACQVGNVEIITLLLDHGANLVQMSTVSSVSNGVTPLHLLIEHDTMDNEKVKLLVDRGYITGEILLEGLGMPSAPAPMAVSRKDDEARPSSPTAAAAIATERPRSRTPTPVKMTEESLDADMEFSCVLLDEEEHNMTLFEHVERLTTTRRGSEAYRVRLQVELRKSDELLALFFSVIAGKTAAMESSDGADGERSRCATPAPLKQFRQLTHWHECYAEQQVRSQWQPPRCETPPPVEAMRHRRQSITGRRSTKTLLDVEKEAALTLVPEDGAAPV